MYEREIEDSSKMISTKMKYKKKQQQQQQQQRQMIEKFGEKKQKING